MANSLELALLFLVAAVLGVVVCRTLKLPPMLGYLGVGIVIGPHALDDPSHHPKTAHHPITRQLERRRRQWMCLTHISSRIEPESANEKKRKISPCCKAF